MPRRSLSSARRAVLPAVAAGLVLAASALFGAATPAIAAVPATVPSAPQELNVQPGPGSMLVNWSTPDSGGSAVTGQTARAYLSLTAVTAVSSCTWQPTLHAVHYGGCELFGLTDGTFYYMTASATNDVGTGPESSRQHRYRPVGVPTVPRSVTATAGNGSVSVAWAAPVSTGGIPLIGYVGIAHPVATDPPGTLPWQIPTEPGVNHTPYCWVPQDNSIVRPPGSGIPPVVPGTRTCKITKLTNGTKYYVAVFAVGMYQGPQSAPRVRVTPRTVASAPRSVRVSSARSRVNAVWAPPAATGGAVVTGYVARMYLTPSGGAVVGSCTATGAGRTCTTGALKPGRRYYVSATAGNAAGGSPASARAAVVVRR